MGLRVWRHQARAIARQAALWALLGLAAAHAGAVEPGSASTLAPELARQHRQRQLLRELLGDDRWRTLEAARFELDLDQGFATLGLSDDTGRQEALERVFVQSLAKLSREAVERRFHLIERRDALRARLRAHAPAQGPGRALDVSPRLRLGTHPWLGLKLRLTGIESPLFSRTSLRLGSELDGGDPSVKLEVKGVARRAFLAYHPDKPDRGETIELQIGLSF